MHEDVERLRSEVGKLLELLEPVLRHIALARRNQEQFAAAHRAISDRLDELSQAQAERNARVINLAARQNADHAAWVSALQALGLKADTSAFERERARFKAEHGVYYLPSVWGEQPDWMQALRGRDASA